MEVKETRAGPGLAPVPQPNQPDYSMGGQQGGYPNQGGYPQPQPGGYPQGQQGGYPQGQQGGYPQPQPGGYPQGQQGGYPQGQQGGYPQGQPGGYPQGAYPAQGGPQGAMMMQPGPGGAPVGVPGGWIGQPQQVPKDCPPGLQYLTMVDQLMVKQKVEGIEAVTGFETNNKYEVTNSMGQKIYYAVEDTCCCTRNCCGSARPFDIKILDNSRKEVIHLSRPLRCTTCWCPCCLQKVTVEAPPGQVVGYVRQAWSCCKPKFKINNAQDDPVLRIKGPCCQWNICGDIDFDVTSADESTDVGRISKQWTGLAKEVFTDADNFGMSFPLDLDVKMKSVMLGAVFLIDFMFFEKDKDNVKDETKRLHD